MHRSSLARVGLLAVAGFVAVLAWQLGTSRAQSRATKASLPADSEYDGPMNKVLVKDYDPRSNLVVPEHHPVKAKFPVIDVHVHPRGSSPQDAAQMVKVMDEVGVEVVVLLTGATGERFDRLVEAYLKPYPDRFVLYCEVTDKGRGFGTGSTVNAGALLPRDKRLHVDDRRLDLFWQKCAELKMPVNLHIADHPSAWQPADEHQERVPSFQRFNQYGLDVPTHAELITRFHTLLERHPKTTFVAVHFSNLGHDFAQLSRALDRFPNLNVDLSARAYEFGRQPFSAPPFFEKYKDRILYGSDQDVNVEMWRAWWRVIETRDEFIEGPSLWRLYGMGLSDNVLQAVYRGNAKRLLNWTKPTL
jgi:predicted TIM-barrel fold metal-dependent hydrolase